MLVFESEFWTIKSVCDFVKINEVILHICGENEVNDQLPCDSEVDYIQIEEDIVFFCKNDFEALVEMVHFQYTSVVIVESETVFVINLELVVGAGMFVVVNGGGNQHGYEFQIRDIGGQNKVALHYEKVDSLKHVRSMDRIVVRIVFIPVLDLAHEVEAPSLTYL